MYTKRYKKKHWDQESRNRVSLLFQSFNYFQNTYGTLHFKYVCIKNHYSPVDVRPSFLFIYISDPSTYVCKFHMSSLFNLYISNLNPFYLIMTRYILNSNRDYLPFLKLFVFIDPSRLIYFWSLISLILSYTSAYKG